MTILMARILLSQGYDVPSHWRAAASLSLIATRSADQVDSWGNA